MTPPVANTLIDQTAQAAQAAQAAPAARVATLLVNELYASIQGESTHAGRACIFVRLTGCPLRCVWCDSEFSFRGGERLALPQILERVAAFGIPLVEVTGGEPLAQPDCPALLTLLCDRGYEVLLETSGAYDLEPVDPRVAKIVDVKCPGSGECARNRWENFARLTSRDELKFVLTDRADYEWAREVLRTRVPEVLHAVHFSPVEATLAPADLAQWIVEDALPARLQLQLHKKIWPGQLQGR